MDNYKNRLYAIENHYDFEIEKLTNEIISELVDFFLKSECKFLEIKKFDYGLRLFLGESTDYEILYDINNAQGYDLADESIEFIAEIMDYLIDNNLLNG